MLQRTPTYTSALKESLRLIKSIVKENPRPTGWTTHELFELARQKPVPTFEGWGKELHGPAPPKARFEKGLTEVDASHPVKSVSFLKNAVLPLLDTNLIKKKQVVRDVKLSEEAIKAREKQQQGKSASGPVSDIKGRKEVWAWVAIAPENIPGPPKAKEEKRPKWAVFGEGEDIWHLNNRRRAGHPKKVSVAIKRMRKYQEGIRFKIEEDIEETQGALRVVKEKMDKASEEENAVLKTERDELRVKLEELKQQQKVFNRGDREMLRF